MPDGILQANIDNLSRGLTDKLKESGDILRARARREALEAEDKRKADADKVENAQIAKDSAGGWNPYATNVSRWVKLTPKSVVIQAPPPLLPMSFSPGSKSQAFTHTKNLGIDVMLKKYVTGSTTNLVFNCHGFTRRPDFETPHLIIDELIHLGNVHHFGVLSGKVNVIWLSACNMALSDDGIKLCKTMAKAANAYVVAAQNAVPQHAKPDHVEDSAGAVWHYVDRKGFLVARHTFIALGPTLGFAYEKSPKNATAPGTKPAPRGLPGRR